MGAWIFLVLSAGNPDPPKIPRFRGGGYWVSLWGGECQFFFMGVGIF